VEVATPQEEGAQDSTGKHNRCNGLKRSNHAYPVVTQNELFPVTVQVGCLLNGQDDQAPIKLRNGLAGRSSSNQAPQRIGPYLQAMGPFS